MKKEIAGFQVELSADGYLSDSGQWNREIAAALAREEGIEEMTPDHWKVIEFLRQAHADGTSMSIRRIGKSGVVTIQEFYSLFPGGPLKKAARIAGIPKPASCV
jgi:tRNA 2-thiouridine synthesizing protein E